MNPYAFLAKLAGIGLVAGTALALVKLVERVWPKAGAEDGAFEYIAVAGEFPPEDEEACADTEDGAADCTAKADTAKAADRTAGTDAENEAAGCTAETAAADDTALSAEDPAALIAAAAPIAAAPDAPNENPVDAPPAAPVTDPLKIADPADFQNWDDLGCQG